MLQRWTVLFRAQKCPAHVRVGKQSTARSGDAGRMQGGWRGRNAIEEREETKRHGEADRKWQEKELRKGRGAAP